VFTIVIFPCTAHINHKSKQNELEFYGLDLSAWLSKFAGKYLDLRRKFCRKWKIYEVRNLHSSPCVPITDNFLFFLFAPTLEPRADFSVSLIIFTDGRTPWTGDQLVTRPLPKHRTKQAQNKRIQRHPCLELDADPRSRLPSERRQYMPKGAHTHTSLARESDSARVPMSQTRTCVGRHAHTYVVRLIRDRLLAEPDS
jgi:hypothetical protein